MNDHLETVEVEVLVVGLGPVGDVLALLLAERGIRVMAIERDPKPYCLPRAASFDDESMRTFQQLGVAAAIAENARVAREYRFINGDGVTLMDFEFPPVSALGWPLAYLCHQPHIEEVLRTRMRRHTLLDMRLGCSLIDIESNDANGAVVVIGEGDALRRVKARFVVGCDGATSKVRRLAGIDLFDYGFEEPWLVIDALVDDETGLSPAITQICDPRRPLTALPMAPGRRRWEFMLLPGERAEEMLAEDRIHQLLAPHIDIRRAEIVRKAVYQFHALVARQWRVGSVLLAGDAAHQTPPFRGQGMCLGLRDAVNLAWKLALVVTDHAGQQLLDTYQPEREPHVRATIETAIFMGRVICTLDPHAAAARDRDMIAQRAGGGPPPNLEMPPLRDGLISSLPRSGEIFPQPRASRNSGSEQLLDDLLPDGFWLITREPAPCDYAAAELPGGVLLRLGTDFEDDGTIAAWLDRANADAVLVRPDRYVFGTAKRASVLLQELHRMGQFPSTATAAAEA
ncbi:MAG: bifunctional 3-(3-hydroxy-phenyl)propionate/3-hydroxycinnamic acid hydroxylase [Acidobacteriota bacterium]|nr:bifunctional 3-(3-hydroxy-phenyl)propionate/3-hydroxycinnamic acid hydroxylase [Acidobacteriota bacterium]